MKKFNEQTKDSNEQGQPGTYRWETGGGNSPLPDASGETLPDSDIPRGHGRARRIGAQSGSGTHGLEKDGGTAHQLEFHDGGMYAGPKGGHEKHHGDNKYAHGRYFKGNAKRDESFVGEVAPIQSHIRTSTRGDSTGGNASDVKLDATASGSQHVRASRRFRNAPAGNVK